MFGISEPLFWNLISIAGFSALVVYAVWKQNNPTQSLSMLDFLLLSRHQKDAIVFIRSVRPMLGEKACEELEEFARKNAKILAEGVVAHNLDVKQVVLNAVIKLGGERLSSGQFHLLGMSLTDEGSRLARAIEGAIKLQEQYGYWTAEKAARNRQTLNEMASPYG